MGWSKYFCSQICRKKYYKMLKVNDIQRSYKNVKL